MEIKECEKMAGKMDREGIRVFIADTVIVYGLPLSYCYKSGHLFEAGLVGSTLLGLGVLIGWIYKSE